MQLYFSSLGHGLLVAVVTAGIFSFVPASLGGMLTEASAQNTDERAGIIAAIGSIANVQDDQDGNPVWILSGGWKLRVNFPPSSTEAPEASFTAAVRMVNVDGTAMHRHRISDFALTGWSVDNTTKTLRGTATVTLRDGPADVPVSIAIKNKGSISIQIDSSVVDHFGSAPMYGTVLRMADTTGGRSMQGGTTDDSAMPGTEPRNGTATEIQGLERSDVNYHGNASGYLVYPQNGTRLPAVIMIHEWWGLNQNIKNMAEQLANEGYAVLAVDLYGGEVATEPGRARELSSLVRNNSQAAIENLQAAVDYVSSLQNVDDTRIASLGWCFGGGQSLQLALNTEKPLAATIIYYGNLVTDEAALAHISWPVLGIFGSADQSIPVGTVRQFESALDANNIENEIYIYEGVGHAFANPSGDSYAPEQAADAWQKTLDFLGRHV